MERTKFQRHKEVISRLGIVFVLEAVKYSVSMGMKPSR